MNFFLSQGRCRVCGKIFCCSTHQRQHEKLEHEEYTHWLEILPIHCRICRKRISTIYDLNTKCVLFNSKHCFIEGITFPGTPRPSRKRRMNENILPKMAPDEISDHRKRLVPLKKQKKEETTNASNLLLVDFSGIKVGDAAINAIFSPQLNVSYKILTSDAKSSTPLNEDKENIAVVSILVKKDVDVSSYCTPENKDAAGTSLILVSALKKITSPAQNLKKNSEGRRVTFETASPSDSEISIYGTPTVTMSSMNKSADSVASETKSDSYQLVTLSPTVPTENIESDFHSDASVSNEPCEHKLAKMARNVRLTLNGIPRSLSSIWEWTQRRIRRKRQRNEFDSPISMRKRNHAALRRRPISSYRVNMSITSLVRDPLPNYKEKYSSVQGEQ